MDDKITSKPAHKNKKIMSFKATPLEKYSSLNQLNFLGLKLKVAFNFNLTTPVPFHQAQLSLNLRDSSISQSNPFDFTINNLKRWRLDISTYHTFSDFLTSLSRSRSKKYHSTQKAFYNCGASLSVIEDDWSQHAEEVYHLYSNVAKRHGAQLYDLNFFRTIAKLKEYHLMCLWYQDALIGALVMIDEEPIYHSMLCGLDYEHSQKLRAYSLMHYEIIRLAIEAQKFKTVDIGLTANRLKEIMGYRPVSASLDINAKNFLLKHLLRMLSRFMTATINSDSDRVEWKFVFPRKRKQVVHDDLTNYRLEPTLRSSSSNESDKV